MRDANSAITPRCLLSIGGLMLVSLATRVAGESLYPRPLLAITRDATSDLDDPRVSDDSVELESTTLSGHLPLPVQQMGNTQLSASVNARRRVLTFGYAQEEDLVLYDLAVPVSLDHTISESWSAQGVITPSLASDFESISSQSVRGSLAGLVTHTWEGGSPTLSGGIVFLPALGNSKVLPIAMATWEPSSKVHLAAGATYVPDEGEERVSPTLSVGLRPTDTLELMISYPRSWVALAATSTLTVYADVGPSGGRWRVSEAPGAEAGGVISLRGLRTGAGVGWTLGSVQLIAEVGGLWNREYEAEPETGDDTTADIEDTGYVMLGLTLAPGAGQP